jgi:hypothetical protein
MMTLQVESTDHTIVVKHMTLAYVQVAIHIYLIEALKAPELHFSTLSSRRHIFMLLSVKNDSQNSVQDASRQIVVLKKGINTLWTKRVPASPLRPSGPRGGGGSAQSSPTITIWTSLTLD